MDDNQNITQFSKISRKQTVINAISNYVRFTVILLANLIIQAYAIRVLGIINYSIWPLITTIMSFVSTIPQSITITTSRNISHSLGKEDVQKVNLIITSMFQTLLMTVVLYAVIFVIIGFNFDTIFEIQPDQLDNCIYILTIMGLNSLFLLSSSFFQGLLRATQKFLPLNIIQIISNVIRMLLIFMMFQYVETSLILMAGMFCISSFVETVSLYTVLKKKYRWKLSFESHINWNILKELLSFSSLLIITSLASLFYWRADILLINKLIDPALVVGYSLVANFIIYSNQLTQLGIGVLGPVTTILHAKDNINKIIELLYQVNKTITPITICILLYLMIYGEELLYLYVGPEFREFGYLFIPLGVASIISITQNASGLIPQAFGRIKLVSIMSLVFGVIKVIIGIILISIFDMGLIGVAYSTLIIMLVNKAIFWPVYVSGLLNMSIFKYYYRYLVSPIINSLPFLLTIYMISFIKHDPGWIFLIAVGLFGITIQIVYLFTVNRKAIKLLMKD